jgi:hypothetical protein
MVGDTRARLAPGVTPLRGSQHKAPTGGVGLGSILGVQEEPSANGRRLGVARPFTCVVTPSPVDTQAAVL